MKKVLFLVLSLLLLSQNAVTAQDCGQCDQYAQYKTLKFVANVYEYGCFSEPYYLSSAITKVVKKHTEQGYKLLSIDSSLTRDGVCVNSVLFVFGKK